MEVPANSAAPPSSSSTFDVFISYSRQDLAFSRRLENTLESYKPPKGLGVPQRHLQVFRDESDFTGVEYFQALDAHLRNAPRCSRRPRRIRCIVRLSALPQVGVERPEAYARPALPIPKNNDAHSFRN